MKNEKIQKLINFGFNKKWLDDIFSIEDNIKYFDDILELFKPKRAGKYNIRIFECDDLDQEPDSGIPVISCFFDDERDMSIIHHFFEGMFYVMNVVRTGEELGRGIVDGAPFDEMEEFEDVSWDWLTADELGPGFSRREKEREEYIEKYNSSLQENENFLENLIERNVNEIFLEYQERKGIKDGDISPMEVLELDELKENLKKLIQKICG